jgi:predicted SprT family Zn-dependent metalloprotease
VELKKDDLISRSAAIGCLGNSPEQMCMPWSEVERMLRQLPAVDAAPVVHGRWVKMTGMMPPEYHGHYECSNCQWHMKGLRNSWTREEEMYYCPGCGARMDGEADEH